MSTIGVFDSGIGGKSVALAIQKALPKDKIIFKNDQAHMPYGNKTNEQLLSLSLPILKEMQQQCDVIVIACNTLSTTIIQLLRQNIEVPLIAIEPMVKPAASLTKTGIIAVCATPSTLASLRYKALKEEYAKAIKVIEPDCSDWAYLIEKNQISATEIRGTLRTVLKEGADVIVLGCTHYHWIEKEIKNEVGDKALVIQPEAAIVNRLKQVLRQLA